MKLLRLLCFYLITGMAVADTQALPSPVGFWQLKGDSVWMEILAAEPGQLQGIVRRHDDRPKARGRVLLKELVANGTDGLEWRGKIWAEKLGEYKDAQLMLHDDGLLKITVSIGFFSRTVLWHRRDVLAD